ncbi:MAG: hypothetical protein Q8P17_04765 [bacterium]|nr:hypothetical protein [bacterium]
MDTSGVFAVQVLGWMLLYGMTHNEIATVVLVGIFSFFVSQMVENERMRAIILTAAFAALCASFGMMTVFFAHSITDIWIGNILGVVFLLLVTLVLSGAVLVIILFEVDDEIEEGVPDPYDVILVLTRIPAGVGTIFGGAVLLYRWTRRSARVA